MTTQFGSKSCIFFFSQEDQPRLHVQIQCYGKVVRVCVDWLFSQRMMVNIIRVGVRPLKGFCRDMAEAWRGQTFSIIGALQEF
jgi:hypothetical protein